MDLKIPGFIVDRKLGAGTFGSVYKATFTQTLEPVALKVMNSGTEEVLERFQREANLLDKLEAHPHVVDVLAWDCTAMPAWLAMEFCEGGSLRAWTHELQGVEAVAAALAHAASGLAGLHEAGGYHRDVKPDNLLVTATEAGAPLIKVGDLGLARAPLEGDNTMTRSPCGTPAYMAPEISRRSSPEPAPTDIYSLGVTGIELLTGSRHLDALGGARGPRRLHALLEQMVAMRPGDRPAAGEVVKELTALLRSMEVEANQPPPRRPRPQAQPQNHGGDGMVLAGLLLGALAAGVGVALYADHVEQQNRRRRRR